MRKPTYPIYRNGVKPMRRRSGVNPVPTFYEFVENSLEVRKNILAHSTLTAKRSRHRILQQFAIDVYGKPSLDWADFNSQLPLKLQNWCYGSPNNFSQNYVAKILDILRTWLIEAKDLKIKDLSNAFESKAYKLSDTPVDSIALTFSEVVHLSELEIKDKRLDKVRDVFVFACLTGLRYSDVSRLKKINFQTLTKKDARLSIIDIVTQKTGERVSVPLHPIAKAVIKRNGGELPRVPSNQKLNEYLKELCELAQMSEVVQLRGNVGGKMVVKTKAKFESISTHTARRTFATIAYVHFKMPAFLVMKATGHKSEREFMKYIRIDKTNSAFEMAAYFNGTAQKKAPSV
jgi:integrase